MAPRLRPGDTGRTGELGRPPAIMLAPMALPWYRFWWWWCCCCSARVSGSFAKRIGFVGCWSLACCRFACAPPGQRRSGTTGLTPRCCEPAGRWLIARICCLPRWRCGGSKHCQTGTAALAVSCGRRDNHLLALARRQLRCIVPRRRERRVQLWVLREVPLVPSARRPRAATPGLLRRLQPPLLMGTMCRNCRGFRCTPCCLVRSHRCWARVPAS